MPIVFEDLDLPGGGTPPVTISVTLWGAGQPTIGKQISTEKYIGGTVYPVVNSSGIWSLDLVSNDEIIPEGTSYRIEHDFGCDTFISYISVPITGGPFDTQSIEVDAMNSVAPGILSIHASDLQLHGGGIELDVAELTSADITVTGSGSTMAVVPGLAVEVPDLSRPIYLEATVNMTPVTATDEVSAGIFPWDGVATTINAFLAIDSRSQYAVTTSQLGRVDLFRRLAPHSPGLFAIGAKRATSPFQVRVRGTSLFITNFRAVTA